MGSTLPSGNMLDIPQDLLLFLGQVPGTDFTLKIMMPHPPFAEEKQRQTGVSNDPGLFRPLQPHGELRSTARFLSI